jgi:virulence factor Mce-like protein
MSRRRHPRHEAARLFPAIGLVAIVVLIAFVYVSYTANNGLPFAPTYRINANVPNADRLIKTDEVRIAGLRVGQVSSVTARVPADGGAPYSELGLALSRSTGPLPVDTRVEVQSASVLGQTYVNLIPGRSTTKLRSGETLSLSHAAGTVELTDLLDIFDRSTAAAMQRTIGGLGEGFAGRGTALNETIHSLARLLPPFTQLSQTLAAPATDLAGFLRGWEVFAATLAPVSNVLGDLVTNASTTLGALASVRPALGATIDGLPPAESSLSGALTRLASPLDSLAALTVRLEPAGGLLPATLGQINSTLAAGVRPLKQLSPFSKVLQHALAELDMFSRASTTSGALRKLIDALSAAGPLVSTLTPAQTVCNVIGIWGPNWASTFGTIGNGDGPAIANAGLTSLGAQAEQLQHAAPSPDVAINYLPHENAHECESGNEPYTGKQQLNNPPGNQSTSVPNTTPPAGVTQLAQAAGLLNAPPGTPR